MKGSKRPCSMCVLIVDNNEWRKFVGYCEAPKSFNGNICVMAPEIAEKQHRDAVRFYFFP